jgi:imidazolonepropionase-like amidohydrolase
MRFTTPLAILAALIASSAGAAQTEPYPSTYSLPSETTLIIHATILTGTGERLDDASLLMSDGKIEFVGDGNVPQGVKTIDAGGRWVTPGLIDVHSHLGVYPSPGVQAHADGNEMTNPATPNVWAEHSVWPNDPGFSRALAGGVTTLQTLPSTAQVTRG